MDSNIQTATTFALAQARRRGPSGTSIEATADDLFVGCLQALSRFGVVELGPWVLDLAEFGIDWYQVLERGREKVAYSDDAVALFDHATKVARADASRGERATVGIDHLLVAYFEGGGALRPQLEARYGITSAGWRAAIARLTPAVEDAREAPAKVARDYVSPEEAAQALGLHVQTVRGYVRSGKLPALRLAGERVIRIRMQDLEKVLEPLHQYAQGE